MARVSGPVVLATQGTVELPQSLLDRGAPLIPLGEPFRVEVHPGNAWQGICGGGCGRRLRRTGLWGQEAEPAYREHARL